MQMDGGGERREGEEEGETDFYLTFLDWGRGGALCMNLHLFVFLFFKKKNETQNVGQHD